MNHVSALAFLALILSPALHAELLNFVRGEKRARLLGVSGSIASLLIGSALVTRFYMQKDDARLYSVLSFDGTGHGLHFGIDALNAPLIPLLGLLTFAFVMGGPVELLGKRELRALLWLESLTLLTLSTLDLAVLAIGWSVMLIPTYRLTVTGQGSHSALLARVFKIYHLTGVIAFLTGVFALAAWAHPSGLLDMSLTHLEVEVVPAPYRPVLFWLLTVGALVRMGVAPFHSWVPLSFERGSILAVTLLVSMRTGFYMLARLVIPEFAEAAHDATPVLMSLALVSAIYGSVCALGQHDLRRMIGFLVTSQSGIMLTGMVLGDPHAISGTLLYWLGFATSTTGLMLMVSALAARTGSADMRLFGGLVGRMPHLSACFLLFALATIAIPGSLAFIAEDMLVHGALSAHPLLTTVMIVAMVINAICLVRAFVVTFLGETRPLSIPVGALRDLLPRERIAAVVLLLALFVAGAIPGPLVASQSSAAHEIAQIENNPPH